MTAPTIILIGDSQIAGHPLHYSFIETTNTTSLTVPIPYHLGVLTGWSFQNMGIGSQTTTTIEARFNADVVALKPTRVVIEGGANDIPGNDKTNFIAKWTSMLAAAQASSDIQRIFVLLMAPATADSNANHQTMDDWNASLVTLVASYSKARVVNASSYVGQFRVGGDAGNLWDIQAAYDSGDGVHFNSAGYTQIAQAIYDVLLKNRLVSGMGGKLFAAGVI
jgi:lysophospholipase L1-like esterase